MLSKMLPLLILERILKENYISAAVATREILLHSNLMHQYQLFNCALIFCITPQQTFPLHPFSVIILK